MADVSDVLYRLRDMAGLAADRLRTEIDVAEKVWKSLDEFSRSAENAAQLVAASDIEPNSHALAPIGSGFETPNTNGRIDSCVRCSYVESLHQPEGLIDHDFVKPEAE